MVTHGDKRSAKPAPSGLRAIVLGYYLGAFALFVFALLAVYGVMFLPIGTSSKYGPPPQPWATVQLETAWVRAAALIVFGGLAIWLLRLARQEQKSHKGKKAHK